MKITANETPIDAFGVKAVTGALAYEMEVEGQNLPSIQNLDWSSHSDGSLRLGGMEYVNKGPKPLSKLPAILENWYKRFANEHTIVYDTERTSVHVHLNMQPYKMKDITKGLVAYYLMEEALLNHCGEARKGNLFCLSMKQAPILAKNLKALNENQPLRRDGSRYSAMNVEALGKFGSVEIRSMRGEYDPEFLYEWGKNLYKIFQNANERFKSPVEVFDYAYGRSYSDFCSAFIDDKFLNKLRKHKTFGNDVDHICRILGPVVYNTDFNFKAPERKQKKPRILVQDDAVPPSFGSTGPSIRDVVISPTNWTRQAVQEFCGIELIGVYQNRIKTGFNTRYPYKRVVSRVPGETYYQSVDHVWLPQASLTSHMKTRLIARGIDFRELDQEPPEPLQEEPRRNITVEEIRRHQFTWGGPRHDVQVRHDRARAQARANEQLQQWVNFAEGTVGAERTRRRDRGDE